MLFQGKKAHSAHQSFGNSVDADYRHFETNQRQPAEGDLDSIGARIKTGLTLNHYDVVIAEGTAPIQTLLVYKLRHPSTKAIYLAADETFYTLPHRPTRHLWGALKPLVNRLLDGIVAVGRDVSQWPQPYIDDVPVQYVHPPISDNKYERLVELTPESPQKEFIVLSAGTVKPANGYEQLVSAVERLHEHTETTVQVVLLGKGHAEQPYADSSVVITPGFVGLDEFAEWFGKASVYVQSSVGDSFPVAALEGILSGTPTLVTEAVGVREILPEEQAAEPTRDGLYEGIHRFYQMKKEDRRKLGAEQRSLVEGITETAQRNQFRSAIEELS